MLLLFDAPAHHILRLPEFDEPIRGGQTFELDDERALEVATDPHLNVIEATFAATLHLTTPEALNALKRDELDVIAVEVGLDPSDFKTKQDVIDALTDQPTAEGEGQPESTDPEQEN